MYIKVLETPPKTHLHTHKHINITQIENIPLQYYNITTPATSNTPNNNNEPMQTDKCNHFIVKFHSYVQFPYEKDLPVHV